MLSIPSVLSCIIDIGDIRPPGSITEVNRVVLNSPVFTVTFPASLALSPPTGHKSYLMTVIDTKVMTSEPQSLNHHVDFLAIINNLQASLGSIKRVLANNPER